VLQRTPLPCGRCRGVGLLPAASRAGATSGGADEKWLVQAQVAADGVGDGVVGVVGAGVGGAALALALQQRGLRVLLFEKDTSFDARCVCTRHQARWWCCARNAEAQSTQPC
jgi:hypothetical protein